MKALLLALIALSLAVPARAASELKLEIRDGKVTLDAKDVTVRQILAEWARVGQTRIVNLERVGSGQVTLQLTAVPEREALDIILRSLSGYMAAPRPGGSAGASAYDRILVLPTSSVAAAPRPQAPAFASPAPGAAVQPRVVPQPQLPGIPSLVLPEPADLDDDQDDDAPPASNRGIVTFGAPQPGALSQPGMIAQPAQPRTPAAGGAQQATPPSASNPWNVPSGTTTPGMVTAPAPPAGARQQAPTPPQPDR